MQQATELEFLKWFYVNADFGPADEDVRLYMERAFKEQSGKSIPPAYQVERE